MKKLSIYNRSYTFNSPSSSSDFQIKPNPKRSKSFKEKVKSIFSLSGSRKTSKFRLPGTEDRVVVYFTSLQGIRRTRDYCSYVMKILKCFPVFIDESDIFMDSSFRKELVSALGGQKSISLPQVFIKGNYVGGVDVVTQFNENGQLATLIDGLPVRSFGVAGQVCETCGDIRFVPCVNGCGSKKVSDEDDEKLKRCTDCNENGLIRCPTCCS